MGGEEAPPTDDEAEEKEGFSDEEEEEKDRGLIQGQHFISDTTTTSGTQKWNVVHEWDNQPQSPPQSPVVPQIIPQTQPVMPFQPLNFLDQFSPPTDLLSEQSLASPPPYQQNHQVLPQQIQGAQFVGGLQAVHGAGLGVAPNIGNQPQGWYGPGAGGLPPLVPTTSLQQGQDQWR